MTELHINSQATILEGNSSVQVGVVNIQQNSSGDGCVCAHVKHGDRGESFCPEFAQPLLGLSGEVVESILEKKYGFTLLRVGQDYFLAPRKLMRRIACYPDTSNAYPVTLGGQELERRMIEHERGVLLMRVAELNTRLDQLQTIEGQ